MALKFFQAAEQDQWDAFVAAAPGSQVLQSFAWGELKMGVGWEPIRVGLMEGDRLVAGVSLLKRRLPLRQSLFYAPRGPVIAAGVVEERGNEVWEALAQAMIAVGKHEGVIGCKLDPEIPETDGAQPEALVTLGAQRAGREIQPRATFWMDLAKPLDQLFAQFEEKTRYNIRYAAKKGVRVRELTTPEGVHLYCQLQEETRQRQHFLAHPESYYQQVLTHLGQRGMMKLFLAYLGDVPIAGVVIFLFGQRVWYMYGASSNHHRKVMPNHALHWTVVQWAQSAGYTLYDLWGIPAHPKPGHPLWGVYRFKKGFGGEEKRWVGMHNIPMARLRFGLMERGIAWYHLSQNLVTRGSFTGALSE